MDFEWQTRAPGDVTSPFYQLSMQHENQKKRMSIQHCPGLHEVPSRRNANGI